MANTDNIYNLYDSVSLANSAAQGKEELLDSSISSKQQAEIGANELQDVENSASEAALVESLREQNNFEFESLINDTGLEDESADKMQLQMEDFLMESSPAVEQQNGEVNEDDLTKSDLSVSDEVNETIDEIFGLKATPDNPEPQPNVVTDTMASIAKSAIAGAEYIGSIPKRAGEWLAEAGIGMGEKVAEDTKDKTAGEIVRGASTIGYVTMYQAPKATANILDFMVNVGAKSLQLDKNGQRVFRPFGATVESAYNVLGIDNEDEFNKMIGAPEYASRAGKLLSSFMNMSGFMHGTNKAMGIKSGWYSTEKSYDAYVKAKAAADIGAKVTPKLAGATTWKEALAQGAVRTGVGEVSVLGMMYNDNVADTWNDYIEMYRDNPEFSFGLLLGGTAVDSASTIMQSSKKMAQLSELSNAVINKKLGDTSRLFPISIANSKAAEQNSVATVLSLNETNTFKAFQQQVSTELDNMVSAKSLTTEQASDAKAELAKVTAEYDSIAESNVMLVAKSRANADTVRNFAINNQELFVATDNLKNLKDVLTPAKAKTGLSKLAAKDAKAIQSKYKIKMAAGDDIIKNNKSVYVINPDGSATYINDYKPNFLDNANPRDLKAGSNGLLEYAMPPRAAGKGKQQQVIVSLGNATEMTLDELPAYSYLMQKNGDKLLKGLKTGNAKMIEVMKSIDSAVAETGFGANAVAQLIETYPEIGRFTTHKYASVYRQLADNSMAKAVLVGLTNKRGNPNITKLAAKFGYEVTDVNKFTNRLLEWGGNGDIKLARDGQIDGIRDAGWNNVDESRKLIAIVDNNKIEQIRAAKDIEAYNVAQTAAFENQINKLAEHNELARQLQRVFENHGLVNSVKQVDTLQPSWLPKPISNLFQKSFGFSGDVTMRSAQTLAEQVNNVLYNYQSNRLKQLRDFSNKLTKDDIIQINKFKHVVQAGFDIVDGEYTLRTIENPDGTLRLTRQNEIALSKFSTGDNPLIPPEIADQISSCEFLEVPDLEAVQAGMPLSLSDTAMDFLDEYNKINKEWYGLRQDIGQIFGINPTRVQDYYMQRNLGEFVNFVYDKSGTNLLATITGNSQDDLIKSTEHFRQIVAQRNPEAAANYKYVSLEEARKQHLNIAEEDWLGWVNANGDYSKLKYNSGRLDRTSITDAFEYDPKIDQTLYDDLLKRGQNVGKLYTAAHFNREIQQASFIANRATTTQTMKERLNEYINLLHGRSTNTSNTLKKLNGLFDEVTNWLLPSNSEQIQKQVIKDLEVAGETEAIKRLIVKLPKAKAIGLVHTLQEFTSWSLVRFARLSQVMLNAVGLVPMSRLAVATANPQQFETGLQYGGRVGLYGVNLDSNVKLGTMDWAAAFKDTTVSMFTKDAKEWADLGVKNGLFSSDALLYRDIVFDGANTALDLNKRFKALKAIKSAGKAASKVGTWASDKSEELSRVFAFSMGKQVAKRLGITDETQQLLFSKNFMDKTVANYSALNKPNVYRGTLGSLLGTFKTYKLNVIQQLLEAYSTDKRGLVASLGIQSVVAGTNSLPFAGLVESAILPPKGNEDGMTKLTELCGGDINLARAIYYGLPSALDIDISNRAEIDPIRGGFTPVSSLSLGNTIPIVQTFQKFIDMGKEWYGAMQSDLPMPASRYAELIGTYSPIGGIGVLGRLASTAYDDSGEEYNYRVDRDGGVERINSIATILGFNSIKDAESYRLNTRMRARDAKYAADMDTLKKNMGSIFRFSKSGGDLSINTDILMKFQKEYLLNGGNVETFYETIWNLYNQATSSKRLNQIRLLGSTKNIQGWHDLRKIMSIENGSLDRDVEVRGLPEPPDYSEVNYVLPE